MVPPSLRSQRTPNMQLMLHPSPRVLGRNTFSLWHVPSLMRVGFLAVSEGLTLDAYARDGEIEEVSKELEPTVPVRVGLISS